MNRERVWAALFLSFRLSLFAALFNLVFGVLLAWVLARYRFPGRRLLDAAVDLPFALPTAVAGIALTALYAPNGVFGALAAQVVVDGKLVPNTAATWADVNPALPAQEITAYVPGTKHGTREVFEEMCRSYDTGVAEFLDLERVKPNTLGNTRMLLTL